MTDNSEKKLLAHWVYTRDEWKVFMRKENPRKSFFQLLLQWVNRDSNKTAPEVKIASEKILIGDTEHCFNLDNNKLRRVNILDAGSINIMEICYEKRGEKFPEINELRIPVPRGKLREAVMVQEKLSGKTDE